MMKIDSTYVIVGSWYSVFISLIHCAIICIVPKLSIKVLKTKWHQHSTALRYAMMIWIMHLSIALAEACTMSNYFYQLININIDYHIVSSIGFKIQAIAIVLSSIWTFLFYLTTLQKTFHYGMLRTSSKLLLILKIVLCIPMFLAGILFAILVESQTYTVEDNSNLVFCGSNQTSADKFGAIIGIFVVWSAISEFVGLSLFVRKIRQV